MKLSGIAASSGIAIGPAWVIEQLDEAALPTSIEAFAVVGETKRLEAAVAASIADISRLRDRMASDGRSEETEIFEGHLLLLEDEELIGRALQFIGDELKPAAAAIVAARDEIAAMFESLDDEYLRERAADIRDVCGRVIGHLTGRAGVPSSVDGDPVVLVTADLTPSDTAQLNKDAVAGFVTMIGGRTSHSAIIARASGFPAIVGMGRELGAIKNGQLLIVDGSTGELFVDPDPAVVQDYRRRQQVLIERRERLGTLLDEESVSADGVHVELAANIGSPDDAAGARAAGAEGIGLFRTEFLYMGRDTLPSEEEQFAAYKKAAEAFKPGAPIVIRTMDIGGDKELPLLDLPKEDNPFLGYRAIRISLDRHDLFKAQLRAILRASAHGNVKIMFPMIATLAEFRAAKAVLAECREELVAEGLPVGEGVEVGIMIEVPGAAMMADRFAREVDFFSIGTNDLTQYTMAADRMNEKLTALGDPMQPAVLRLIERVIRAAETEGKWVGMCGEMAGQPHAVPLLLGLGLQEFSMSANAVLEARALIRQLSKQEMAALAAEALDLDSPQAIRELVEARVPAVRGL
ncbi:phosphoenolpyruvate--protein phosphotransferase [Paenibacillus sp. OV219]|uniref:phosphoenolpyruvate--protein phosphotransferase n=1 Tax=Paenibacillus sp. OV219 TaxID=1884377 RepID=UPI0008CA4994|nr:phosphoenolpyruvate--protein phosphotransferase [Paenibacillus sp. OV219]SEN58141.1 phosphotransferase system, enzyme I, PtsI [Paenibacillus sp. OV219]